MVLDTSLFNIHFGVVAIEKGAFELPTLLFTYLYTHTHYIYIYIYIYIYMCIYILTVSPKESKTPSSPKKGFLEYDTEL